MSKWKQTPGQNTVKMLFFPTGLGMYVSASGGREVPEREGSLSRSVWKMDGGCFLLLNQQ